MEPNRLIRDVRRRHGVSQASLARRARTSQTHVSRIERGEVSPSVETLERLLECMGERLELRSLPAARVNQSTADLRADYERRSPGERVAEAAELSHALTSIAGAGRK